MMTEHRMSARISAVVLIAFAAASFLLAGCAAPGSSNLLREDLVYLPPSTGTMVGRWVPKSQVNTPSISPTATMSNVSLSKLQNEGTKTTPSNHSMGLSPTRR
ncbi:MAG: hypothetical protein EXS39_00960 [Opitutaceae bacterium]|nr:hypothetical protein [Opitutaceae bacterium]